MRIFASILRTVAIRCCSMGYTTTTQTLYKNVAVFGEIDRPDTRNETNPNQQCFLFLSKLVDPIRPLGWWRFSRSHLRIQRHLRFVRRQDVANIPGAAVRTPKRAPNVRCPGKKTQNQIPTPPGTQKGGALRHIQRIYRGYHIYKRGENESSTDVQP